MALGIGAIKKIQGHAHPPFTEPTRSKSLTNGASFSACYLQRVKTKERVKREQRHSVEPVQEDPRIKKRNETKKRKRCYKKKQNKKNVC